MILGIDLRCLPSDGSEGAGIAHAARHIALALCSSAPDGWTLNVYLPKGAKFTEGLTCHAPMVELEGSSRADLLKGLSESPCDLLFVPSGAVSLHIPVPAIPWVHDVDIYEHPEWFGEGLFTRLRTTWMFRKGLVQAPIIFTVSEYTKKEARALLPKKIRASKSETEAKPQEIIVTGEGGEESLLGIDDMDRKMARERLIGHGVVDSYILMLGTVEPRKNIPFMLSTLLSHPPRMQVVIAGKNGWKTESIQTDIDHASKALNVVRINEVSDMLRKDLLMCASMVLVPSKSEGFGLVALEGIQAGVPVIASDRGALPEIVGDTALPLDVKAWSLAIDKLLSDTGFRQEWIAKQRVVVERYTWKRAAESIWTRLASGGQANGRSGDAS